MLAVLRALGDSIDSGTRDVRCPFRKWVEDRYFEIGVHDEQRVSDHLSVMCSAGLRMTAYGDRIPEEVTPSLDYCRCSIPEPPNNVRCLFRSVVNEATLPTVTVGELHKRGSPSYRSKP